MQFSEIFVSTRVKNPIIEVNFRLFESKLNELMQDPQTADIPNGKIRKELLQVLIRFYQLHVDRLGEIKSLQVLSDVLAD